jgi:putative N6-adenine-specific DNA methylase
LRLASRVWLRLGTFPARDAATLRIGLRSLSLAPYLGRGGLELSTSSHRSPLRPGMLEQVAREAWTPPPGPSTRGGAEEGPGGGVLLRADGDRVAVSVDSTGELLHRRGYRQEVAHAPLRETLAAGVLALAGYDPSRPLWDPMCGSGTLPIEAAWIALGRAPGMHRSFAFERWPSFEAAAWAAQRGRAEREALATPPAPIWATDLHAGALGQARRNARRAGLEGKLRLERHDATQPWALPPGPGLVVANLPYGKRVGEVALLPALARGLGAALRASAPGWRFALLVGEPRLERDLGLAVTERRVLDNGGLKVTLLLGSVG